MTRLLFFGRKRGKLTKTFYWGHRKWGTVMKQTVEGKHNVKNGVRLAVFSAIAILLQANWLYQFFFRLGEGARRCFISGSEGFGQTTHHSSPGTCCGGAGR